MNEKTGSGKRAVFMRFEYRDGALDPKTRELVLLAAAAVASCRH